MITIALVGSDNVAKTSYLQKIERLGSETSDVFKGKTIQILNVNSLDEIDRPIDGVIAMYSRNDKDSYCNAVSYAITIKNCVLVESNTDLPKLIVFKRLPSTAYFYAESLIPLMQYLLFNMRCLKCNYKGHHSAECTKN